MKEIMDLFVSVYFDLGLIGFFIFIMICVLIGISIGNSITKKP